MKVVNRRGSYQHSAPRQGKKAEGKRGLPPCTPLGEKGRAKKFRRGLPSEPSFARACVRKALDAELDAAVGTFNGSAEDRRIWASIAWRVGVESFHHAVIDKIAEDRADGPARRPAAAFQAFLNARFPKGGAA